MIAELLVTATVVGSVATVAALVAGAGIVLFVLVTTLDMDT